MPNLLPAERVPRHLRRKGGRGRSSDFFPDLNLSAAAEAAACTQSHLSNILHGERNGTIPTLMRVAATLGITLDALLQIQREASRLRSESVAA